MLFQASGHHCCSLAPLFTERLFVIARRDMPGLPTEKTVKLARWRESDVLKRFREERVGGRDRSSPTEARISPWSGRLEV